MGSASSASATWRASASASEWTATVAMPSARALRMIRQAISPRFAISSFFMGTGFVGVAGLRTGPGERLPGAPRAPQAGLGRASPRADQVARSRSVSTAPSTTIPKMMSRQAKWSSEPETSVPTAVSSTAPPKMPR